MSNNDLSLLGETANPAATPIQPPSTSSTSLQPAVLAGGPHTALRRAPPIPVFTSPFAKGFSLPAQPTTDSRSLAKVVARHGLEAAALVAEQHHRAVDPANAPTSDDLISRVNDAKRHLKKKYDELRQGSSNAIALRLLAPQAGPSYEFEKVETPYTDQKGKTAMGKKCGCPGCENHNHKDRRRHMAEMHVKDPARAIFCPEDGCKMVYYDTSRGSEMGNHIKSHENCSKGAQRKGRGNQNGPAQ